LVEEEVGAKNPPPVIPSSSLVCPPEEGLVGEEKLNFFIHDVEFLGDKDEP